ncbi:MAG: ABC transporter substrate-binding protein [Chloroflexi bacterium]|nr:ABC transporter substrate-binding protein [Chloroflexota bacterium]
MTKRVLRFCLFWHAMSGSRGDVIKAFAEDFNKTNKHGITVKPEFTGSYAETVTKALAAYKTGKPPHIVQVYEVGTQTMRDSKAIIPIHTLNRGDVDFGDVVQPIVKYYSVGGQVVCMPFNSSTAMLYYNKDIFKKAGLDPNKPPTTFDEVYDYGKKIVTSGSAKGGISFGWPAWIFEQMYGTHNQLFANQDNGRSGLANEVYINNAFGVKVLTEWQKWSKDKVLVYGGREYDANAPFLAGEFAMLVQSTSSLGGIQNSAKGKFEIGTTFLPRMPGYPTGNTVVGGGCLWVMKGRSDAENLAAWEFLKHVNKLDNQITWHKKTGYFPATNVAVQSLMNEGWFAKEPNYLTAFMEILVGVDTPAGRGVLLGNFVEIRDVVGAAIEEAVVNMKDPKTVLDAAQSKTNQVLKDYAEVNK